MNKVENKTRALLPPIVYWRLWLLDAALVSTGFLFLLATRYGTREFFGMALLMALLPLIPILVLVGGAGSTVFALTKVLIEKRALKRPAALALLVGPGVLLALLLGWWGVARSPARWLNYICLGNAPAAASQIRVAGYSTFLREEWLAVFHLGPKDFQTLVAGGKLAPADDFEFRKALEQSSLKNSRLFSSLPSHTNLACFKRVFQPGAEHERGSVYAVFDAATSTAVVFRGYHD